MYEARNKSRGGKNLMAAPVKTWLSPEIHAKMVLCAGALGDLVEKLWEARMLSAAVGFSYAAKEPLKQARDETILRVESLCELDLSYVKDAMESIIDKITAMDITSGEVQDAIRHIQADLSWHLLQADYEAKELGYTGRLPRHKPTPRSWI
jgi:hypothetical protein